MSLSLLVAWGSTVAQLQSINQSSIQQGGTGGAIPEPYKMTCRRSLVCMFLPFMRKEGGVYLSIDMYILRKLVLWYHQCVCVCVCMCVCVRVCVCVCDHHSLPIPGISRHLQAAGDRATATTWNPFTCGRRVYVVRDHSNVPPGVTAATEEQCTLTELVAESRSCAGQWPAHPVTTERNHNARGKWFCQGEMLFGYTATTINSSDRI